MLTYLQLLYDIPSMNFLNATKLSRIKTIFIKIYKLEHDNYMSNDIPINTFFNRSLFMTFLTNDIQSMPIDRKNNFNIFVVQPTLYRRLTHFGK